ncbi:MAG: AAA family ATPase [bacterium]|nr:AAA family ATPase [Acidimicrobiia bacterium]MCY4650032.1 AAA family ATPase [bacterium]
MEGKRFIRTICLQDILSYGPNAVELALEPLNVLIGPNGSGKSNLINVLSVLRGAPRNLPETIRRGGGTNEWLWKGRDQLAPASVEITVENPTGIMPLRYGLAFTQVRNRFELYDETLEDEEPQPGHEKPFFYYRYQRGDPVINITSPYDETVFLKRRLEQAKVDPEESILSQRRDPDLYPELTSFATQIERIGIYREWNLGTDTPFRLPQNADLPQSTLLEDGTNLGLVLNNLMNRPPVKREIMQRMRTFYPGIEDITTTIVGRTVEVFFHEGGLRHPIPADRLSEGSLRFLCLLVVLCHPEPHLITSIEEPELGLHPDIIPDIADLLVEASKRTQLVVTTHSDILLDALTDVPESVIVCEKREGATHLRRLERENLKLWLKRYRLGELWSKGEIGGNRW